MIISRFNRYFEKHGRKTYIALGIIISLMFVVFVTPGDVFGGGPRSRNNIGSMYGKKLKTKVFARKMRQADLGTFLRYNRFLSQEASQDALIHETLRRMRALREAQRRGLHRIETSEVVAAIHEMPFFKGEEGVFSPDNFRQFKNNFLAQSGLTARDFDEIVKENLIIERLENQVIVGLEFDESEVAAWTENYEIQFAEFNQDTTKAAQPTEQDIEQFFADRKAEIVWEKQRAATLAGLNTDQLSGANSTDPEVMALLQPSEEEISRQYESMKDRLYKDKTLEEVKTQITATLRSRKIAEQARKKAQELAASWATALEGLSGEERLQRFKELAEASKAMFSTTGLFSTGDQLPGLEGRHPALANAIRKLSDIGQVSPAIMAGRTYYVAYLTDCQPGTQPAELNDEAREKIAEALLTERAMAFYQDKIAIFQDKVPTVKTVWELAGDYEAELMANKELSDEERTHAIGEYREMLRELVMPFFKAERRSSQVLAWKNDSFLTQAQVTEDDLQAAYDERKDEYQKVEVRVAKVEVKIDANATEEEQGAQKAKMDAAVAKLQEGEDFTALVKEYSEDEESKDKDGDSGWLNLADLEPELAEAYGELELNQVSKVVTTANKMTLAKLLEKKPARELAEVKEELTEIVRQEAAAELAKEAAANFTDLVAEAWEKALENDRNSVAATVFAELAASQENASLETLEQVVESNYAATGLARERDLMSQIFATGTDNPFTNVVSGGDAAYVACLTETLPPYLNAPLADPAAMVTLKNVYKRHLAMQAAERDALAAADRINDALANEPDLAKVAGEVVFKPAKTFSRMSSRDLTEFHVRDQESFLKALHEASVSRVLPPQKTYGGYVLVFLQSKIVPVDEETAATAANVRNYLQRQKEMEALGEFYQRLEAESNTVLIQGMVQR